MARREHGVVAVAVEYVGNDLDLWCFDCMLCTGARVWFTTTASSVTTLRYAVFCTECGGRNVEDDA